MPITISFLNRVWITGSAKGAGDVTCKFFYYAAFTAITASILSLTVIAIDRYCAVFYPLSNIRWFRKAKIISPVIWILSLALMSASPAMTTLGEHNSTYVCTYDYDVVTEKFWVFFFLVNYLLPLIVISVLYGAIARKLWSHEVPGNNEAGRNQQQEQQRKRELVRMLVIIVAVFALCWLPTNVYQLEMAAKGYSSFSYPVMYFCFWLSHSNSAINPWLYIGLNRKFHVVACTCVRRNGNEGQPQQNRREVNVPRNPMPAPKPPRANEPTDSFGNRL
ncbi:hypothetical protein OS493_033378 [Desmophyllum pertusum]|uniref:G-protein coupled receptors family 1 profile domain-containing protein n=1 Tax=Desmophyllum pertusum TaxID=174260 RepID=A0A9W9YVP2_9CNID|nr:hypothetical protein OS493_033378 [Desmophyllum pertusum]